MRTTIERPLRWARMARAGIVLALTFASPAAAQDHPPEEAAPVPATPAPDLSPSRVVARIDSMGPIDEAAGAVRAQEDWLADGQRRDAIAHGAVSPYFRQLERTMRSGFHPDLVAITAERRASMTPLQIVADELQRYGPPEAPHDARGTLLPEMRSQSPEEIQTTLGTFDTQSLLNAHTRWQRVEVHVEQDREGVVTRATVTHSSGSSLLDHAALDAVRHAAAVRPPEDVVGTRTGITSDWAFWAGEVVPFLGAATPGIGATTSLACLEGPDGQGLQCTGLGRPLLRTRVELLDVHDAQHEPRDRVSVPAPSSPDSTAPARDDAPAEPIEPTPSSG